MSWRGALAKPLGDFVGPKLEASVVVLFDNSVLAPTTLSQAQDGECGALHPTPPALLQPKPA